MSNNERKTKELELDVKIKDSNKTVNKTSSEKDLISKEENNKKEVSKKDNSFYDRKKEKPNVSFMKSWKGKTLFISLVTAILIAGSIPLGMFSTGYFSGYTGPNTWDNIEDEINNWNPDQDIINDIQNATNNAYVWYLDAMNSQGFFVEGEYDELVKTTKDSVNKTIEDEKESYKDQYGDIWKSEWEKNLSSQGFDNEEEYKQSLIANDYKEVEVNKITAKQNFIIKDSLDEQYSSVEDQAAAMNIKYYSDVNDNGYFRYINNNVPANMDEDTENDYSGLMLTPEDITDLYLAIYQPIMFNDSSIGFLPTEGPEGTEATFSADNIVMTNTQIWNSVGYYKMLSGSEYEPGINLTPEGIQSKRVVNLDPSSEEPTDPTTPTTREATTSTTPIATATYYLSLTGETTSIDDNFILTTISAAFAATGNSNLSNVNSISQTDVNKMTSTEIDLFEKSMYDSLNNYGLIDTSESTTYRNWATISNAPNDNSISLFSYVENDGLHSLAVAGEGKQLVIDYLNTDNESDGYENIIDSDINTNMINWVNSNMDYFILNVWLQNGDYSSIEGLDENIDLFLQVFYGNFSISAKKDMMTKLNEVDEFFQTNWKTFDYNSWVTTISHKYFEVLLEASVVSTNYDLWIDNGEYEVIDILNIDVSGGEK